MFKGKYIYRIDSKGRVNIPPSFREVLQSHFDDRLIVTNFDLCLVAFPAVEWDLLKERLQQLSILKEKVLNFMRFFYSGASECTLDKQGRILIPLHLREYAQFDKEVVIIGVSNRIEIWNKERWEKFLADSKSLMDSFSAQLLELSQKP
ncbi:division/cell wall cluster transcriptional repressor MraZ [bacterium (candidate division B38) B3_B38]|nr:MAG: division/cell wall cluster transcriptional repressor MraZ [bacterium (candidate division B38) B3_B38]